MNGEVCCILGICCPPNSAEQLAATVTMIRKSRGCSEGAAREAARVFLEAHDYFRSAAAMIDASLAAASGTSDSVV